MADIRHWLYSVSRRPGIAAASIAAIAVGIGANTAVLAFLSAVLFEPLPYDKPERLVMVWGRVERLGLSRSLVSPANYHDWKSENNVFEKMGAYTEQFYNLEPDDGGAAERLSAFGATPSFLETLGVRPIVGRGLRPEHVENDGRDGPLWVLISHGLWQRRFGSDMEVPGRRIVLSGRSAEIVGVLPPGFFFLNTKIDILAPLAFSTEQIRSWRAQRYLTVVARLKDGIKVAGAQAEMETVAGRLAEVYPDANKGSYSILARPRRGGLWSAVVAAPPTAGRQHLRSPHRRSKRQQPPACSLALTLSRVCDATRAWLFASPPVSAASHREPVAWYRRRHPGYHRCGCNDTSD